ncbi:MAG: flavodoxin family protein [Erysipelotrichaceae bacterium]|nr:flavodoxin family protein [Erysipelotrichaceae bacterium]
MKVLIINGSPHPKGSTYTALHEVEKILHEEGIETKWVNVSPATSSCLDCDYCGKNDGCVRKDQVNETYPLLDESDGLLIGSPVYYAGMNGALKSFLDRLFISYPNRKTLNLKAAASLSCSRRAGNLTTNDAINKFFSISGMTIITSTYWNDPHGNYPEEVIADEEGLQTLRNLGRNMAYYLKMREAAKEKGLPEPVVEKGHHTNFVR